VSFGEQAAVLGFICAPWTIATYLVEGRSSLNYQTIKKMIFEDPRTLSALLSRLANELTTYLIYQIDSGAQYVQIFDSWGGSLPPHVSPIFFGLLIFLCPFD
jgi:uroporphyrinogen decarboxylase